MSSGALNPIEIVEAIMGARQKAGKQEVIEGAV